MPSEWKTFRQVFEAYDAGHFERLQLEPWVELDTALWEVACRHFPPKSGAPSLPEPLIVYYATRRIHWEVENGGFAQACMNYPVYLEVAEQGFLCLGWPDKADLVSEARVILEQEADQIEQAHAGGLETAFEYMDDSPFDRLDDQLDAVGWFDQGEPRVRYMLDNRADLMDLD